MKVKRKSLLLWILLGWILLVVEGCNPINSPGPSEGIASPQSVPATETEGVVTQMNPSATPFASGLENLIVKAKEDLAQRLSISASQINLVEARDVVWPNSSLGCPEKGMVYAEVLTSGYLVILESGGNTFEYHAGIGGDIIYCKNPTPPIIGTPSNT